MSDIVGIPIELHAGGVTNISRWQAPKASRHRIKSPSPPTPAGVTEGAPAPHPGCDICEDRYPVVAHLRCLPPANVRNASGVLGMTGWSLLVPFVLWTSS
jgi:hypothetical protein